MAPVLSLLLIVLFVVPFVLVAVLVRLHHRLRQNEEALRALARRVEQWERPAEDRTEPEPGPVSAGGPASSWEPPVAPAASPGAVPGGQVAVSAAGIEPGVSVPGVTSGVGGDAQVAATAGGTGAVSTASSPVCGEGLAGRFGRIDWERFMGVKLFAWIGGFALFLAVAFFIKYSFENNWISPAIRVGLGFATGLGLVAGGVVLKRRAYEATSQTLCATGIVILYAVSYACQAYYHFTSQPVTFGLMVAVTVTAFMLSVRLNAQVVAILGLVGGFVTPPLLAAAEDRALALFGYVALLDAGLVAVALRRRWPHLAVLGVVGTVFTQLGWVSRFFAIEKAAFVLAMFAVFNLLFLAGGWIAERRGEGSPWLRGAALTAPFVTFGFALGWVGDLPGIGLRPGWVLGMLLAADLPILALVLAQSRLHVAQTVAGWVAMGIWGGWVMRHLAPGTLSWALAGIFILALLHTAFPAVLQWARPGVVPVVRGHWFPVVGLGLMLCPVAEGVGLSWGFWPVVLALDLLAIGLAFVTGAVEGVLAALGMTLTVAALWIIRGPAETLVLSEILAVTGGCGLVFYGAGVIGGARMLARRAGGGLQPWAASREESLAALPSASAALPFAVLVLTVVRLPMTDPSAVYGLALLLAVLLLWLGRWLRMGALAGVAFVGVLTLEYVWYGAGFSASAAGVPLAWALGFTLLFVAYPFACGKAFADGVAAWATAALAGPLVYLLVHRMIWAASPNEVMGLVPAGFGVLMVGALAWAVRVVPGESGARTAILSWLGGSALFFITLIVPVQYEKEWITLGWALEGVGLLWLYRRLSHSGLRYVGGGLLAAAFMRLALNPAVFDYHARGAVPVWNWYLYAYGVVAGCLFLGGRLLMEPRETGWRRRGAPALHAAGTILVFLLVNIEIADYFAKGPVLTFQFSGDFARDMTYSIAWSLFALMLLVVGVGRRLPVVRYAGLALLGVTVLKLFFHDLVRLSALYRIGAFLGVAVISILASVLYQRFFAGAARVAGVQSRR